MMTAVLHATAKALLVGCGHDRTRKLLLESQEQIPVELVTLDMSPEVGADVVWDMEDRPLPFDDEEFDQLHFYDSLEHWGQQGDWRGFFDEFAEYHRILKPGGTLHTLVPFTRDYFADPGHTRFFGFNHFGFLSQQFYEDNSETSCTDYRWYWKKDFGIVHLQNVENHHIAAILRKQ